MSVTTVANTHLICDTVMVDFEGEVIHVHLEFLPSGDGGTTGSVEMYDDTRTHV